MSAVLVQGGCCDKAVRNAALKYGKSDQSKDGCGSDGLEKDATQAVKQSTICTLGKGRLIF